MKTRKVLRRSRTVLGIVAAGALVCGLTLHGATPRQGAKAPVESAVKMLEQGFPVPAAQVPWAPPMIGRSSRSIAFEAHRGMNYITGASSTGWEANAGTVADGGTGECELDEECDSCNPCLADHCDLESETCDNPADPEEACEPCDDGLFCNGVSRCDGDGNCLPPELVKEHVCKGGPRIGRGCTDGDTNTDCHACEGGSRDGEVCGCPGLDATCTAGVCDAGFREGQSCVCPGGACIDTGTCELQVRPEDPCENFPDLICDELEPAGANRTGACVEPCRTDEDCDNELGCDGVEICVKSDCPGGVCDFVKGVCIGGLRKQQACVGAGHGGVCHCDDPPCAFAGVPCTDDTACGSDYCVGVCRPDPNGDKCGQGAISREPCDSDSDCGPLLTGRGGGGRCCVPNGNDFDCSRKNKPDCLAAGGSFLGVGDKVDTTFDDASCDDPSTNHTPAGEYFSCPKYAAGVTEGNLVDIFGPAGVAVCRPFWEIGDDYRLENCDKPDTWYEVLTVRGFFGYDDGTGTGRMRITFYDTDGTFIEDVITDGNNSTGIRLQTVPFSEKPVIPCAGIITLKPAEEFQPAELERWATTDACPGGDCMAGTNDVNLLYVRLHDGLGGKSNPLVGVTPASLGLNSGVLALEIVGNKTDAPFGACCGAGACREVLPWVCEAAGDSFQGIGTSCRVCSNTIDVGCTDNDQCPACVGGDNPGLACPLGTECGTGTCSGFAICTLVPPACETQACCIDDPQKDPILTCINRPACVIDGVETGRVCLSDDDVANCVTDGGICEHDCPTGTTTRGIGSDCDPNCCEQQYSGADTCAEAQIVVINVPALDEGEVTYTFTGNNKFATFGDYVDGGGGTCQFGMFNEDGGTRDRGWWHAFSIDDCANVRVDLCCTKENSGDIHQPQWSGLWTECNPCGETIATSIVGKPVGLNDTDWDRGMPFCSGGDDLWRTFGPLPKGIYYQPIYSATGGHFGEYQFHVAVSACPVAACCLPTAVCIGGPTPGGVCEDNLDCCAVVEEGQCQDPAPGTCVEDCTEVRQTVCEEAGGFWQGINNLPLTINPVVTCGSNNANCGFGSCCLGPGECQDTADPLGTCDPDTGTGCMDWKGCVSMDGDSYVGGARCDFPLNPCPACQIVGEGNCQGFDGTNWANAQLSDLAVKPNGVTHADDFIPATDTITRVCTWGIYLDQSRVDEDLEADCEGRVLDNFRVRIYEDNNGSPGTLVATRWIPDDEVAKSTSSDLYFDGGAAERPFVSYTLAFDAITLPAVGTGQVYWLEVANDTRVLAGGIEDTQNTCYWHWAHTFFDDAIGNKHVFVGTGDRPCPGKAPVYPDGVACDAPRISGYNAQFGARYVDMVFCLGNDTIDGTVPFEPPATPTGAVCGCLEAGCTGTENLEDMVAAGGGVSSSVWRGQNTICNAGICDEPLQEGDNCGGSVMGSVADGVDCTPDPVGAGEFILATGDSVGVYFDTSCANTDGPPEVDSDFGAAEALGFDVWICYTATCTGRLTGSLCASGNYYGGYDAFMAVYHDGRNPDVCPCPGQSTQFQFGGGVDESCNGIADGGAPMWRGPITFPDEKWLFRVGGWGDSLAEADRGRGFLDIGCEKVDSYQALAPLAERLESKQESGGQVAAADPVNYKNRFISITTAEAGRNQSIRVRFISLPEPFDIWNGAKLFVGKPRQACENSGKDLTTPPALCPPALPTKTFWTAPLVCEETLAWKMDWRGQCVQRCSGLGQCSAGRCDNDVCVGGLDDGAPCVSDGDCAALACAGGSKDAAACDEHIDCPGACFLGENADEQCLVDGDCGGFCSGGLNEDDDCTIDDDCVEYVHIYHEGLVPSWVRAGGGGTPAVYYVDVLDDSAPGLDRFLDDKTCVGGSAPGKLCPNGDADCTGDLPKVPHGKCLDTPVFYSPVLIMEQPRWGDVCGGGAGGACSTVSNGIVDVANDVLGVLDKFANLNNLQKARADIEPGDNGFNNGPDFKVNVASDVLFTLAAFAGAPYPFTPGDMCIPDSGSNMARGAADIREVVHEGSK